MYRDRFNKRFIRVLLSIFICCLGTTTLHADIEFDDFFNNHQVAMLLIEPKSGRIVQANKEALQLYGYQKEELEMMRIDQINDFTPQQIQQEMQKANAQNRNYFIFRHRKKNGETILVEVHSHPYKIGSTPYLLSMVIDISAQRLQQSDKWYYQSLLEEQVSEQTRKLQEAHTAKMKMFFIASFVLMASIAMLLYFLFKQKRLTKQLQEKRIQLQQSHNRYFSLLNSMDDIVFIKDASLKYVLFNTALEKFFDLPKEQIYNKTDFDLMDKKIAAQCYSSDIDVIKNNTLTITQEMIDNRVYETKKFPVSLGDNTVGLGSIISDITRQYNYEKKIKQLNTTLRQEIEKKVKQISQKDKLLQEQAKLAAMGEMIGAIAHQWRQPLNALSINIQNLDDDYADGLIDERFLQKFIEKQTQTINFMSKTIDDFRNFFKVQKHKEVFDVMRIIQEVQKLLHAQLLNSNITLRIDGEGFEYESYKGEFQQVILNIINNSKDAIMDKNTEGLITIVLEPKSKTITVTDNGGGVDEKIIDRIFEPYFSTKQQGKGTGIGLHMSRTIITEHMNGTIVAHNVTDGLEITIGLD
ncbi:MAG: PAS domain S-box protein [Campylobacterota bacterium]